MVTDNKEVLDGPSSKFRRVISVYAHTAKAPQKVKDKFGEDLQHFLDHVPSCRRSSAIVLGDLNIRISKRSRVMKHDVCMEKS